MPAVTAVTVSDDPQVYEDAHVHSVYDEIAPHFSSTRYKVRSPSSHDWTDVARQRRDSHGLSSHNSSPLFLQAGSGWTPVRVMESIFRYRRTGQEVCGPLGWTEAAIC